jgi:predicted ATPase/DNA-binding winged helix-turn-helix (wHTH) protein
MLDVVERREQDTVRFRFGEYELDLELFELRHRGAPRPLEPQVFDVLAYLLAHHDRVVTKDELLDNVWGDRFVSESALSTRIKAARRAVGDDGRRQEVIRTVHGRGFRVVADITRLGPDDGEAPARVSLPGRPLRRPTSSFVGRDHEVRQVSDLVGRARIITITGAGGVGKTRLAVEVAAGVADRYPQPPRLVELAEFEPSEDVIAAVAAAVGVQERPGVSLLDRLVETLADQRLMLVVDNCEHVARSAAALVAALVDGGGGVDVLATSRTPLRIDGERVWPLGPLATEASDEADPPAVRLFLERAAAQSRPEWVADLDRGLVRQLCDRLDGVPLCVELAASRLRHLGLDGLVGALEDPATLVAIGIDEARHGSIEAVIAWSYDRLPGPQQRLFQRLSVFAGSFDAAAAHRIAGGGSADAALVRDLSELVDQSMVNAELRAGTVRYSILQPLRHFARRKLQSNGEEVGARGHHAEWALDAGAEADRALRGPGAASGMNSLEALVPELRLAHRFLLDEHDHDGIVRLTRSLFWFAQDRGHADILSWSEDVLDSARNVETGGLAVVHATAAVAAWQRGDVTAARSHAETALATAQDPVDVGYAQLALAEVHQLEGKHVEAVRLGASLSALAEHVGDALLATLAHVVQALSLTSIGHPDAGRRQARVAVEIAEASRSPLALAWATYAEGEACLERAPDTAFALLEKAMSLARRTGARLLAGVAGLSAVSARTRANQPDSSLEDFVGLIDHWRLAGTAMHQWTTIRNLVEVLVRRGAYEEAARLFGAVSAPGRGSEPHGAEAARLRQAMADVRHQLGDGSFKSLVQEGARLTDSATVAYARALAGSRS